MTDKTPPATPPSVNADPKDFPDETPPVDDALEGENEVLREARRAKALETSANAKGRPGWKTAAGIGVGVGVGSAALIAALLYAKRRD